MDTNDNGRVRNPPGAGNLVQGLRDYGYTVETAVADLVDNSITAGATEIDIRYRFNPADTDPEEEPVLAVIDNGRGMDRDELFHAMTLASRDPSLELEREELGRFGLGLKTASFSQCRELVVISRREPDLLNEQFAKWDLDEVVREDDWIMSRGNLSSIEAPPFLEEYPDWSTMVLWRKMDRLLEREGENLEIDSDALNKHLNRVMNRVSEHLGLHFHRFLKAEGGAKRIRIRINNSEVVATDPFLESVLQPVETERVHGQDVSIVSATIPHPSHFDPSVSNQFSKPAEYFGHQGFYVYREKRLVSYGGWFGLMARQEKFKLTRVKVDIPNSLDRHWALDVKKSFVRPPKELLARLKDLLERMGAPSATLQRKRGRRMRVGSGVVPLWNRMKRDSRTCWKVNEEHPVITEVLEQAGEDGKHLIRKLFQLIENTLPVSEIYTEMTQNSEEVELLSLPDKTLGGALLEMFMVFNELLSLGREEVIEKVLEVPPFQANKEKSRSALMTALQEFDKESREPDEEDTRDDGECSTQAIT